MRFVPGTLVKNLESGIVGVTVSDPFGICSSDETPVCTGGEGFVGVETSELEKVGVYNPKVGDLDKCGGGKRDKACKFLALGPEGVECARFGPLHFTLIGRVDMVAKASPEALYPNCQEEIQKGLADSDF